MRQAAQNPRRDHTVHPSFATEPIVAQRYVGPPADTAAPEDDRRPPERWTEACDGQMNH